MSYSYRTPLGLPVRYTLESDTHIENEFLFGLYEYLFTGKWGVINNGNRKVAQYFVNAFSKNFPNHIIDSVPQKKLSHDQLTAYYCYAYSSCFFSIEKIQERLDKTKVDWHPRDAIFYSLLKGNYSAYVYLLLFYFICAFSFFVPYRIKPKDSNRKEAFSFLGIKIQTKLSGELLWVLRYEAMQQDLLLAILAYPLKVIIKTGARLRYGSVKAMVFEYFYNDIEHPILKNWSYEL